MLVLSYDQAPNASAFFVLDARDLTGEPLARDPRPAPRPVRLPRQLGPGGLVGLTPSLEETSMSNVRHVLNYAIKFEQAYAARDLTLIEPCFTPEATYVVSGAAAFAGTPRRSGGGGCGTSPVSRKGSTAASMTREVLVVDGPAEREGCLWFRWAAIYHLAGAPDLRVEGESFATLSGDEISRLEDRIAPEEGARVAAYFERHEARLAAAR